MASVSFESLVIGQTYERTFLSELWGYKSHEAISRGSVTPKNTNYIILFITKQKQDWETQYRNYIENSKLYIDGQEKHGSDQRIIMSQKNGDAIHLFYRDLHRDPFEYFGEINLIDYQLQTEKPSRFVFSISNAPGLADPIEDVRQHEPEFSNLSETEQITLRKSRVGQGEFRKKLIDLWGACSVTGIRNLALLRASHSKPWSVCSNQERLNPLNGLLLTPALDHLYDSGLITFNKSGKIIISSKLNHTEMQSLAINSEMKLRNNFAGMEPFISYHREQVFKN